MAKFLQIFQILISILVLGVAVFINHPPEEVTSNLSKWLKFFGINNSPHWISNPSIDHYLTVFLVILVILVWVLPYVLKRRAKAFEIIYDAKNVGYQFRDLTTIENFSSQVSGVTYRIKIRNKTTKTLQDVRVTSEALSQTGSLPVDLVFSKAGQKTCTLDPNESVFVEWFFVPLPLTQPGIVMRSSTAYGPLRVTVSAKDTKAVERVFKFVPLDVRFDPLKESLVI